MKVGFEHPCAKTVTTLNIVSTRLRRSFFESSLFTMLAAEARFHLMAHDLSLNLPEELTVAAELTAKAFGMDASSATLLLLHSIGAAIGPAMSVRSPDMVDLTPGFDIALTTSGGALLHGAILHGVTGIQEEVIRAGEAYTDAGRRELCERHKARIEELHRLMEQIEMGERESPSILGGCEPPRLDEISRDWRHSSAHVQCRMQLPELRAELERVEKELVDLSMALQPGAIREDGNWTDFLEAGRESVDGTFLQIAPASMLFSELSSKSNQMRACAHLIQRSKSESPIGGFDTKDRGYRASVNLYGNPEEFRLLLRHKRLQQLGFFNTFVFCNADGDRQPCPEALDSVQYSEDWSGFIALRFRRRVAGERNHLSLGPDGLRDYLGFREWTRDYISGLPVDRRIHFLRWPELMLRVATCLAALEKQADGEILGSPCLQKAAGFLKHYARRQRSLLDQLMTRETVATQSIDDGVEKLVRRLREKGPQTLRQLARGIHGQDYKVIDARVFAAIQQGLVFQKEGHFWAANVSVNASTEPDATEIEGGVAA